MPRVSVIIPCRDGAATLAQTLASVRAQSWPQIEIIVVDDGSSDGSAAIAEAALADHRGGGQVVRGPRRGANAARRAGFEHASGDYVQWLDADDLLAPDKIERQVQALEAHACHDIAHGDWVWEQTVPGLDAAPGAAVAFMAAAIAYGDRRWQRCPERAQVVRARFATGPSTDYLLRLLADWWAPPHAYLVRAKAARWLHEHDGWHLDMRCAQDREYYTKAALHGQRFVHVREAIAIYRTRPSGAQITARIDPAQRAEALAGMQRRLAALPRRDDAPPLREDHRFLLGQDRRLWLPRRGALSTSGTSPPATALLAALARVQSANTLEEHAKQIAWRVPALWGRHVAILRALVRLAAEGRLDAVT
jgi:hypothetical protein